MRPTRIRHLMLTALLGSCVPICHAAAGSFPVSTAAPANAPNVVVIMTDDVGYGAGSTFGGAIPTPTMDRLAQDGLRYANFHTTALCSPSRAALLTGRNHHAVGFGNVADLAHDDLGYTSIIPKSAGTLGQILSANGYDAAWFGKNHNVPTWQSGPLGPFDQWASGLGFGYFYGFHGGLTDQFAPALIENRNAIEPPAGAGYVLDRDLADHALRWIAMQRAESGGRPFLLYYAPGTGHAPVQAPAEWIARFRGAFDAGWDAYRERAFARQKALGIVPADAKLAPMPPGVVPWASLGAEQKRVYARYMEAYAGMLAYCDDQIGRLMDALRRSGQLDNTIVIYIQGDNGATPEGGTGGTVNYHGRTAPAAELDYARDHLDEIGGPNSSPVLPLGWSAAMNTPYPYYKVVASRLGGVTNAMVISWPKGIAARGVRRQFTHLVDVVPTILDAIHLPAPKVLNGSRQQAFDGTSFAPTFASASTPATHRAQYFEMMGNAAYYRDGWLAASPAQPLGRPGAAPAASAAKWQLYDLTTDSTQTTDVAYAYPARLKALRRAFDRAARRNRVLPIGADSLHMVLPESRPEVTARAGSYDFTPSDFRYAEGVFPSINNRSWRIEADLDVPANGGNGVIVTQGGRFSGWGLVMLGGRPNFVYRQGLGSDMTTRIVAAAPLAAGAHRIGVSFKVDGPGLGRGGTLALTIDGKEAAQARLARSVAVKFAPEDASIGHDTGTPLLDDYRIPFAYDGLLRSVSIKLEPVATAPATPAP